MVSGRKNKQEVRKKEIEFEKFFPLTISILKDRFFYLYQKLKHVFYEKEAVMHCSIKSH